MRYLFKAQYVAQRKLLLIEEGDIIRFSAYRGDKNFSLISTASFNCIIRTSLLCHIVLPNPSMMGNQ